MQTVLIVLPLTYNPDGRGKRRRIEKSKFVQTGHELTEILFGVTGGPGAGATWDPRPRDGYWWNAGVVHEDRVGLMEINGIPDSSWLAVKEALRAYCRETLLERFQQDAILMKFIPRVEVEVVEVSH